MSQVSVVALLVVTVNCEVLLPVVPLAGMLEKVIEKAYCWTAPGSPVMAAPLLVFTELAMYTVGRTRPMPFVPVKVKVNLAEFDVPVIVRVPPSLPTAAASSISTNSVLPAWMMVRVLLSTPEAL